MQTTLNDTPTLKTLVGMIEELYSRGAYLDFIRMR
jgi:hypothetical protein